LQSPSYGLYFWQFRHNFLNRSRYHIPVRYPARFMLACSADSFMRRRTPGDFLAPLRKVSSTSFSKAPLISYRARAIFAAVVFLSFSFTALVHVAPMA
jgi:hypothetical protein